MNELQNTDVQESVQKEANITSIIESFNAIVQKIVYIRKQAGFSQYFMADWLEVDRRKIIALEAGENLDIELLFNYAKMLDIDIDLMEINK